ncbi:6-phosphogluconolactonase, partial [Gammaproteobacteria bacterium]|nr:6-phosphogluconolactonase [Gammaproteobacteria bacterium]
RQHLDAALANDVAQRLRESLTRDTKALLCLSGGSTPAGFLTALSEIDLDWTAVTLLAVDERYVAVDHADSNTGMIQRLLQQNCAASASLVTIYDPQLTAERAAARLDGALRHLSWPPSVSILGMGEDGHTASFFPDSDQLEACFAPDAGKRVLAIDTPSSPHRRITLSAPALLESETLILHITGEAKRGIYQGAFADKLPIARVIAQRPDARVMWAP